MEPNANRLFWHEDSDGDSVEIIHGGHRVEQMTVGVRKKGNGVSRMVYLDRTAVEGLHAVLGRWLDLNTEPEQTGVAPADAPGPAQDTPGLRRSAMDMAIASGHPEAALAAQAIALHLVHTLSCPARDSEACTCGGAVPGVPVPVLVSEHDVSAPECSLSEPVTETCSKCGHEPHGRARCWIAKPSGGYCSCRAPLVTATCSQCGHGEHDQGECSEHELQGGPRCSCIASKALRGSTDTVPESVLARCAFCGHDRHGAVGCGAGGRGIHRCGCRGIPQDGGQ